MENILKSIGTLCMLAYITGLVSNMVNVNHTQKSIRLVCALYIISSLTFNKKTVETNFSTLQEPDNYSMKQDTFDFLVEQTEHLVESNIKSTLSSKNISYTDVNVHIHKQSDKFEVHDIYIDGVDDKYKINVTMILNDYTDNIIFGE